jgi:hypothetical protein
MYTIVCLFLVLYDVPASYFFVLRLFYAPLGVPRLGRVRSVLCTFLSSVTTLRSVHCLLCPLTCPRVCMHETTVGTSAHMFMELNTEKFELKFTDTI